MKLFLAVIFFCSGGQCYFWKSPEMQYSHEECLKILQSAQQKLNKQGIENEGTCLPINIKNYL